MKPTHLIRAQIDPANLMLMAHAAGAGNADDGYAVHQALAGILGDDAPTPFAIRGSSVLAYTTLNKDEILARAEREKASSQNFAKASAAINLDALEAKPLPSEWPVGLRLRFEVTAPPMVRQSKNELDPYKAALDRGETVSREEIYLQWLQRDIERRGGAEVSEVELTGLSREVVTRRKNGSGRRQMSLWVAQFRGVVTVTDSEAFSALVARGVGRHRAFGCGMLLLSPVR